MSFCQDLLDDEFCHLRPKQLLQYSLVVYKLFSANSTRQSVWKQLSPATGCFALAKLKSESFSNEMQQSGKEYWWRPREAAILAVGCVSPILKDLHASHPSNPPFDTTALLNSMLQRELAQPPMAYPFLSGRALWAVARSVACAP